MLSVAINGFGRMGRSILRAYLKKYKSHMKVVWINDIANWENLAYLLEFDSVHKSLENDIKINLDSNTLIIDDMQIQLFKISSLDRIPKDKLKTIPKVDILIESSGRYLSKSLLGDALKIAKKVILSAPTKDSNEITKTYVLGVNNSSYNNDLVFSNASCTTNCIAPICSLLDKSLEINYGMLSTIHSYTSDQFLLDNAHKVDKRRSRAAAQNIIPTTTKAAIALNRVLPNLENKIDGISFRVPVLDVSIADLNITLKKSFSIELIKELLTKEQERLKKEGLKEVLKLDSKSRVSSDFLGDDASLIIPLDLIRQRGDMLKITAWYDNEVGYANRILDLIAYINKL